MSAGATIAVLLLLAALAGAAFFFYKRWKLRQQQRQLMAWAGAHLADSDERRPLRYSSATDPESVDGASTATGGSAYLRSGGFSFSAEGEGEGHGGRARDGGRGVARADDARFRAATLVLPSEIEFASYSDGEHGFKCSYPAAWTVTQPTRSASSARGDHGDGAASASGTASRSRGVGAADEASASVGARGLLVQFTCPDGESHYKRLSVTWDDVAWANATPESFAAYLLSKLPAGQSRVVSSRAAGKRRNAHEMVYVVADPEDPSGSMKLHSMVVLANSRAFTVTFGVDEDAYPLLEALGRFLLNAFVVIPQPVPTAAETPPNPRDVDWDVDTCAELGVAVARPRAWTRSLDTQRRLLRLTCLRGERVYKALRVLTVDLSSVRSADLLQDLASQFAMQAKSEGSTVVQQTGVANGPDGSPAIMFRCTGTQGMLNTASVSVVGVKTADASAGAGAAAGGGAAAASPSDPMASARAGRRLGYVLTFSTLAADDSLARYEGLARHMFASLRLL